MRYTIISDNYVECLKEKTKVKGEVNYPVKVDISKLPQLRKQKRLGMSQDFNHHKLYSFSDSLTAEI